MGNFMTHAFCVADDSVDTHLPVFRPHAAPAKRAIDLDVQQLRCTSGAPVQLKTTQDCTATRSASLVSRLFGSALCSIKNSLVNAYDETLASLAGSSVVLSQVEEDWYNAMVSEVDAVRFRYEDVEIEAEDCCSSFLGPSDTIVATVDEWKLANSMRKRTRDDDDCASCTTEATDDDSKCDFSDSEAELDDDVIDFEDNIVIAQPQEIEYYAEDDDTETKADRLLRLASTCVTDDAPVYVDDYLCPCGECPQYHRIACDVKATVTWRNVQEQHRIIRVLQAFSTYNEVVGYRSEMIEAAEECLQLWLGDEDQALKSLVMLYDEVPQLCAGLV